MARRFSMRQRLHSFRYALRGLKILLATQHNTWLHLLATMAVIIAATLLPVSATQWCLLIIVVAIVWITEAINTAIEFLADVVSPEFHPAIGLCKDVAAAAVLVAAIAAAAVGLVIFGPWLFGQH